MNGKLTYTFSNLRKPNFEGHYRQTSYTNFFKTNIKNKNNGLNALNLKQNHKQYIATDYYKDPNFLNEINLQTQLEVLKTIDKEKIDKVNNQLNIRDFAQSVNLPILAGFRDSSLSGRELENVDFYYKSVFKMKPLFKKFKPVVDNKLNMRYAENEQQYKQILEKENKILKAQGKPVKNRNCSELIDFQVNEIKKRIRFMKGIMDFSYPGFVLTKIRTIDKQLKLEKEYFAKLHEYHSPVEVRNQDKLNRNLLRKKYLFNSINIKNK